MPFFGNGLHTATAGKLVGDITRKDHFERIQSPDQLMQYISGTRSPLPTNLQDSLSRCRPNQKTSGLFHDETPGYCFNAWGDFVT